MCIDAHFYVGGFKLGTIKQILLPANLSNPRIPCFIDECYKIHFNQRTERLLSAHLANIPENWGGEGSSEIAPLEEYLPCMRENLSLMTRIHVKSGEWWHAFVISALGTGGFHEARWPADPPYWQVHSDRPCLKNKMTLLRNTSLMHTYTCLDAHVYTIHIHTCTHTQTYIQNICIYGELT